MPYKITKISSRVPERFDGNSQPIHRKEAKTEGESGEKPSGGPIEES